MATILGSGELNIVVLTDDPDTTFRQVQDVVQVLHPKQSMRIAYRDIANGGFAILWPPNLKDFSLA
jgi:hypothetical protein